MRESGGKFIGIADCALDGHYNIVERAVEELERAVKELNLQGLKVHPSNYPFFPYERYFEVLDKMDFTDSTSTPTHTAVPRPA